MAFFHKLFNRSSTDEGGRAPRLVVIGLDGTPYTFVQRLLAEGRMPNLARIVAQGGYRRMDSVYPTVSSVAWSSYMTGVNPARHGIYGFIDRRAGSYETIIPDGRRMKAPTLWEMLSQAGKRVIVLNVPVTYPPRPVNGILVSCFLSPRLERAVYPPEKTALIQSLGYRIDTDAWLARESRDRLYADVEDCLARRGKTLLYLMDNEPWDFVQCHIMETDRLYHFSWEQYEKGDPLYAPQFYRVLARIDDLLGEVLARVEQAGAELMVLSDHGFCTIRYEVYVNTWLAQKGWLPQPAVQGERVQLKDVGPGSQVYSLDPGRVFINLAGREPAGTVAPEDYEAWRARVADAALAELRDPQTGEPMLEKVLRREEVYDGPGLEETADLILVPRDGYDLKGAFGKETLTYRGDALVGMHTYDDAMIAVRGRALPDRRFSIIDATATVLRLMEVDPPPDIESRSLI